MEKQPKLCQQQVSEQVRERNRLEEKENKLKVTAPRKIKSFDQDVDAS